jgi:hypothetical protein
VKAGCIKTEFYVVALAIILDLDESVDWIAEFYFITN